MRLLGTPLLVCLSLLAVLLPVTTVAVWHRVRGGRVLRASQHAALVVLCQLVGVALVAVGLNDYGDFYGSWSSLLHTQPQHAQVASAPQGATPSSGPSSSRPTLSPGGSVTILADPPYASRAEWSTRGRLESVIIHGGSSALQEHAYVFLPPQYFQSSYAHVRFPAIEVMSGYPGAERDMLVGRMNYPGTLLQLIDQHRITPTVLVMLLPNVNYPHDTECTNVPAGPQAETFYDVDVPAQASRSYRVLPIGWGAIGGSTGGYCAVKFAMLRPTTFPAAVSIQGYFMALKDDTTGDLWGGSRVLRNTNDLEWRLQHLPAPPVSVMLVSSKAEFGPYGYVDTQLFASLVKPPMNARTIIYPSGGHNIATWRVGLADELTWLSSKLHAPASEG